MFILRDLLADLQTPFSTTALGREWAHWFIFTLLAVIVPFTSSMTSNLLRSLSTLFGLDPGRRRFYTFMALPNMPWQALWRALWQGIPNLLVEGRSLIALDDSINNKTEQRIFGCSYFHDHTAKPNLPRYPWSQNIVSIGLLKTMKGRWCCLPLAWCFYLMDKDIKAKAPTTYKGKRPMPFQTKMAQAVEMLCTLAQQSRTASVLVVADSWLGNDGLFRPLSEAALTFELLSRLRAKTTLYELPPPR